MRLHLLLVLMLIGPAAAQFQPTQEPEWGSLEHREDIAAAGNLTGALRVLRFVQVSDVHIIDDDAPPPIRVDPGDEVFYGSGISSGAARPQEEYTDELLDGIIRAINDVHALDELAFVLMTGDNIDNQLENELMRFIDNWDGTYSTVGPVTGNECKPDGQSESVDDDSNDVDDACTHLPDGFVPTGLAPGLPWFVAFGNHDGLIQGNVAPQPSFRELAAQFGRYFLSQPEFIDMHFDGGASCVDGLPAGGLLDDQGHGFAFAGDRLCDEDPDNNGYYAFDTRGIRFIVLDTINDDPATASESGSAADPEGTAGYDIVGGLSEGAIDPAQYAWLLEEISRHRDKLVFITSHHTVNSMWDNQAESRCGPSGCPRDVGEAGYISTKQIIDDLDDEDHVIAWLGGHTHRHRIEAKGEGPAFWNIETSSLVDLPQQARIIEVWVTADQTKGFITATRITHDLEDIRELAGTDDQKKGGEGTELDQDVLLWFDMPPGVFLAPQASLPRFLIAELDAPGGMVGDNVTVTVHVKENLAQRPVSGLDVSLRIDTNDDEGPVLVHAGPAVDHGDGNYTVTFVPEHGRIHYVRVDVIDPTGTYGSVVEIASMEVEALDEEPTGKKSPGIAGILPLALVGAALWLARR